MTNEKRAALTGLGWQFLFHVPFSGFRGSNGDRMYFSSRVTQLNQTRSELGKASRFFLIFWPLFLGTGPSNPNPAPKWVPSATGKRAVTPLRFSHKRRKRRKNAAAFKAEAARSSKSTFSAVNRRNLYMPGDVKTMKRMQTDQCRYSCEPIGQPSISAHETAFFRFWKTHLIWMETAAVLPCPVKIKLYYFFFFSLKSLPWAHFCGGVLLPQQRPLSSSASPFKCLGWRKSDVIVWNFITRPTFFPFFRRLSHVAKHNFAIYLKKICPVCVVCRALKYSCRHHRYGHDQEIHQKIICGWKSDIFKVNTQTAENLIQHSGFKAI